MKFGVSWEKADEVCSFTREGCEAKGYADSINWTEHLEKEGTTKFFDSVTGVLLYEAPKGRTLEEFIKESRAHGWPSFRDEEIVWEN